MQAVRLSAIAMIAALFLFNPFLRAADIFVTTNIQIAIDTASSGDVIHLAAGKYPEILTISNKNLSLVGTGTNCVIYNYQTNPVPLISITGPATVTLSNFQLIGGWYQSWWTSSDWYEGYSPLGILSSNANLTLNSLAINQIGNFFVTVWNGSLFATNMGLWTYPFLAQCDIGLELDNCVAAIDGLTQDAGLIDHTININGYSSAFSDVTVVNSRIRASQLTWGNCVRTYVNSKLVVTNCNLYRGTDTNESVITAAPQMHDGVGIFGYSNNVVVAGNVMSNLPWAMYCCGSIGGNQVRVECNSIFNSLFGGVFIDGMSYKGLDLGGGALGSRGGNLFSQSPQASTNYCDDVLLTNLNGLCTANLFALHNTWSNPTNKEAVIYDKLDNPAFGRLITDDLTITPAGKDAAGRPVISWNERGAGESYTVQMCGSLAGGNWTNAPGSWPVTNPGLGNMCWTNPAKISSNTFCRIRSLVP